MINVYFTLFPFDVASTLLILKSMTFGRVFDTDKNFGTFFFHIVRTKAAVVLWKTVSRASKDGKL